MIARLILPAGAERTALPILAGRGLRAFADGYVAVLLPAYLLALGFGSLEVGFISTATLIGSALATVAVGSFGHRFQQRRLLLAAALLMAATGLCFAGLSAFWPLVVVAFVGTLNPSTGDVSMFLPLEHARLAEAATGEARTALFARYTLAGSLCGAIGALAAAVPEWLSVHGSLAHLASLRVMFVAYGVIGALVWLLYRRIPERHAEIALTPAPLGPSRPIVLKLAALFSVDAFAGGLMVNSLLALWLFQRFGMSLSAAGIFFFGAGLLTAVSQLIAPVIARHIGLINTMVFTHIPSSICLILAALAPNVELALGLLFLRAALSQMDVPTRSAFVMTVVTPAERAAAASFTAVPRSLAASVSPSLGGALLSAGALATPLIACGVLKIAYDLALLFSFRHYEDENSIISRRTG
ncbi:MAG TPA: MFS transporter [Gallionella sp.]|nr:MFS transporter [Gallionella sp.]